MNMNNISIYTDDIEMGNNNDNNNEVNQVGNPHLGRSLSIIAKGQIQISKLVVDSPLLVNLSPNRADRELIINVLRDMDSNKDGVIDYEELIQLLISLCGQVREKERAEFEKKLAQKTAKSQWNLIVGLSICLVLTIASTFASSFASVFIAKDTTISSGGNNLLNKRNGQTISTSAAEIHYDLFGTDDEEEMDTATSEKNATVVKYNKLGCIGGNQIEALATGSLSQPVILTDAKGGVHKIDGHDLKFFDDGGAVIVESSGRIIQIKKDVACATSTEGRRLQDHFSTTSWGVVFSYCSPTRVGDYTVVNEDMHQGSNPDSQSDPDGFVQIYCHEQSIPNAQWLDLAVQQP